MPAVKMIISLFSLSVNILSSYHPSMVTVVSGVTEDTVFARGDILCVNGEEIHGYSNKSQGFTLIWDGNERSYEGTVEAWAQDGEVVLVNKVPQDDYLASVVGGEMVPGAGLEALKAQAILARTFIRTALRHRDERWGFCDLTHCQSYKGLESTTAATRQAVDETDGMYLTFNGELCDVYYHSTSGGRTADVSSIWPDINRDYLVSVPDPYSQVSPHYRWEYVVSASQLARALGFPDIEEVEVVEYSTDGRVKQMAIKVGQEALLMEGWEFRMDVCQALGWNTLKSSWFEIGKDAGAFVFKGKGLGHGVGLSQWGAKGMADEGKTFRQILAHYFPGTEVKIW